MAKKKQNITELIVIGDPDDCGSCARAKEFIKKNKKDIKAAGVDRITLIDPAKNKRAENLSDDILGVGNRAAPLFVIKKGDRKKVIPGFPRSDDYIPDFSKKLKRTVKKVRGNGLFGR